MSLLFNLTLSTLFFITLSLLIAVLVADYFRNKRYFKPTYEELKNSYPLFLKYIDRYYITNMKYTILACLMYFLGTIMLFLIIRYMFLGQLSILMRLDKSIVIINYGFIIIIIFKYIACFLSVFFYKILLQILFYKEVIKLRIYLISFFTTNFIVLGNYWGKLYYYWVPIGQYICKFFWILSYRIATQSFHDKLFEGEFDDYKDTLLDYEEWSYYNEIYKNIYFQKILTKTMMISKKYILIANLFYLNAKLFKFLSKHVSSGLFKFIPQMCLFLCILYDIYNRQIYIINYATYIYVIYYIIRNAFKFEHSVDISVSQKLSKYFYKNDFPYSAQRTYILEEELYSNNKKSNQNDSLFYSHNTGRDTGEFGIIACVLRNITKDPSFSAIDRKTTFMYLRFTIFLAFFIINIFIFYKINLIINIFNTEVSNLILFFPNLLMLICTANIYYGIINEEFTKDEEYSKYIYNIKYSIPYWILVILEGYLFYLILLKPELFLLNTEILIELPYNILKITKIYSAEEKNCVFI